MKRPGNGWTGGQYSVWRAALGVGIAGEAAWRLLDAPRIVDGIALVVAGWIAIGWRDRAWALVLGVALLWDAGTHASWSRLALVGALGLHALAPRAPYGSWDARGRVDVRGGWHLPTWLHRTAQFAALGAVALAVARRVPPLDAVWLVLLALDPAWLPGRGAARRIYYDGHCGLCHRFVRFVLAEDRNAAFRFAPLQGATFEAAVPSEQRAGLPDSVVVAADDGRLLVRSRAVFHALGRLGGLWRALGGVLALLPAPLADFAYDRIAAVRHRVFGRPADACPLMPAELRERFDP